MAGERCGTLRLKPFNLSPRAMLILSLERDRVCGFFGVKANQGNTSPCTKADCAVRMRCLLFSTCFNPFDIRATAERDLPP